jgi:hypothetical protein
MTNEGAIELDEEQLRRVLLFMLELNAVTGKTVVLTPENCRHTRLFRCVAGEQRVRWVR